MKQIHRTPSFNLQEYIIHFYNKKKIFIYEICILNKILSLIISRS